MLKIFSKTCYKQVSYQPGFVLPFIEHKQRIFKMVHDY